MARAGRLPEREGLFAEQCAANHRSRERRCARLEHQRLCDESTLYDQQPLSTSAPEDDIAPIDQDEDGDEWPPFKKVGIFDPFSDDPRLGIRRVVLCPKTFNLLVAGTAGQVIVFELKDEGRPTAPDPRDRRSGERPGLHLEKSRMACRSNKSQSQWWPAISRVRSSS
ncbi:hypothetical protein L1887_52907 [Cichorium endivia]|nr:hypothetical protein L1887_52907 [Cichorium endivia]